MSQARRACPRCLFTDTDHWSLHGVDILHKCTLLASRPLSNMLKMLVLVFHLCGSPPTPRPSHDAFLIGLLIDYLKKTIKNRRNYFCYICFSNRIYGRFYVVIICGQFRYQHSLSVILRTHCQLG